MSAPASPGFYPSPYNSQGPVVAAEHIRPPLHIIDVTLREGQQAPGVAFSPDGERAVTRALASAGVSIVQAGYAVRDEATVARIHDEVPGVALALLAVGWSPDLTAAALTESAAAGASICSILMRSSPRHLSNLGLTPDEAVRLVAQGCERARSAGFSEVIVAPSFSTLADFGLLERFFAAGVAEGATIVSIADSTGIAKPAAIREMVSRVRDSHGEDVGIKLHTHNDYGLALANALAGIEAGASWIDASVLGLGERAGNVALEELVVALDGLYGLEVGIDPAMMTRLCEVVARHSGFAPSAMKPVVGRNVFSNKLELHVKAIAADPTLLEPYDPAAVGGHRELRLGRGTGPTGVRMKAAEAGIDLPEDLVDPLVAEINRAAADASGDITDEEFFGMVAQMREDAAR
jgi:isopropylmalate/homocitrate/citramalate synthase